MSRRTTRPIRQPLDQPPASVPGSGPEDTVSEGRYHEDSSVASPGRRRPGPGAGDGERLPDLDGRAYSALGRLPAAPAAILPGDAGLPAPERAAAPPGSPGRAATARAAARPVRRPACEILRRHSPLGSTPVV